MQFTAAGATGARVDKVTYDPALHIATRASRQGAVSAVAVEAGKLTALGDIPYEPGTGDIVSDPKTHTVWIGAGWK